MKFDGAFEQLGLTFSLAEESDKAWQSNGGPLGHHRRLQLSKSSSSLET